MAGRFKLIKNVTLVTFSITLSQFFFRSFLQQNFILLRKIKYLQFFKIKMIRIFFFLIFCHVRSDKFLTHSNTTNELHIAQILL